MSVVKRAKESSIAQKARLDDLFVRAAKEADKGNLRAAFRLFLAAARAGDTSCQINLGNFYDEGKGVRRDPAAAMYWYKRAYRRGEASAAHNIGVMYRNEEKHTRAVQWFRKSVRLGNSESNLDIAKYFLDVLHDRAKAIPYLKKVRRSKWVTEAGFEEAKLLLRRAR